MGPGYPCDSDIEESTLRLGGGAGGNSVWSIFLNAECSRYAGLENETGGAGRGVAFCELCRCILVDLTPAPLVLRVRVGEVEVEGKHVASPVREEPVSARTTRGSNVVFVRGEPLGGPLGAVNDRAVDLAGDSGTALLLLPRTPAANPSPLGSSTKLGRRGKA